MRTNLILQFQDSEGNPRACIVPAEAITVDPNDQHSTLAAIIIALHDRVTALERQIAAQAAPPTPPYAEPAPPYPTPSPDYAYPSDPALYKDHEVDSFEPGNPAGEEATAGWDDLTRNGSPI